MSPTTKQQRASSQRRTTARARGEDPARSAGPPSRPSLIPSLAGVATLGVAVPSLWPGLGVRVIWSSALFALAAGAVGMWVVRPAIAAHHPEDAAARATAAIILVLAVAMPVIWDPRAIDGFSLPKLTATVIGAVAIGALWAVETLRAGAVPKWRNGLHWPVLAFFSWTALATATSVAPRLSIVGELGTGDGLLAAAAFAVIFFAVVQVISLGQVKAVLGVLYFGAGGLTVLYGLIQLHDRLWGGSDWDWTTLSNGVGSESLRIFSGFGNPNHLGGFLAVLVPIGAVLLLLHKSTRVRILIGLVMACVLVELVQTGSRGGFLAALVAVAMAGTLLWRDMGRRTKTALPAVAGLLTVVVVGTVAFGSASRFDAKFSPGETLTVRAELWRAGVAMANARPLVGQGPDTWDDLRIKYWDPKSARGDGDRGPSNGAHNLFIGQLAATGYPGLGFLVALLGIATLRAVGTWRRLGQEHSGDRNGAAPATREARLCLIGVVGALAAFLVQASVNVSQIGLTFVFWTLLGLLCVISRAVGVPASLRPRALLSVPKAPTPPEKGVDGRSLGLRAGQADAAGGKVVAGAVMACAGLLLAGAVATRPIRADHKAAAALFDLAASRNSASADSAALSQRAMSRLEDAIDLDPWQPLFYVHHANAILLGASSLPERSPLRMAALRRALGDFEQAIELRPYRTSLLENYADILLEIHRLDPVDGEAWSAAAGALRRAVRADPYSSDLRQRLQVLTG